LLTIFCMSDIDHLDNKLHPMLATAISQELTQLREILNIVEGEANFQLDTRGYTIACLEHQESLSNLSTIGLSFPFLYVEYVEIYKVQEMQYYRILLMHDNECFTVVFTIRGTQNNELEKWFSDQAIQGEDDYL
jgi:hypothetical protein